MWWRQDWEQYKRNLAKEREEYGIFEIRRQIAEERMLQAIESAREEFEAFKEKKKAEYKRRVQWAHRAYMREVEKKFKPSIT